MTENNNVCGFRYFQVKPENLNIKTSTNDIHVSETEMKRKLCQLNGELSDDMNNYGKTVLHKLVAE